LLSGIKYIPQSPHIHLIFIFSYKPALHDENINILNDLILLSRGNVSQMAAEKNECREGLFKCGAHTRGHWDRKKRPGVDFFAKAISAGLTN